jgi:TRAP-type C4-dicarboxylate transport system permease large subunit
VETLKRVSAVFADAVAGGAVVNISLLAAKGVMVTAVLVAGVPPSPAPVSVAVNVHEVPVSMITLLNVETKGFEPPVASTVSVEVPSSVHDEEITIGSPDAPPAVIDTVKLVNAVPAFTLD